MSTNFEERYLDVLQNIEAAIVRVYHERPDLLDYDVDAMLDALISRYKAEEQQRNPRPLRLTERQEQLFQSVQAICEWRLGRSELVAEADEQVIAGPPPISLEEIVACLKRIKSSVRRWTKQRGRQGYLTFVQQYVK
jgi:hypothetical protein